MHKFINQLKDNEKIKEIYQVAETQLRPNKNGNLYIQFSVADKTGTLGGRLWNVTEEQFHLFDVNDYVEVEGVVQRFQGALQLIAKNVVKVDSESVNPDDYRRFRPINIGQLQTRLREMLKTVENFYLKNLCDCILFDEGLMSKLCKTPAGVKLHHAYPGGLLEHTITMMETVLKITPLYPMLNRDILLVGAFLHDIGKTEELSVGAEMIYTDSGQMLGHPFLGVEILHDKIRESEKLTGEPFDPELAMVLKHLLISHHGTYDNGSAKLPMTLEAIALHHIDSLDSKIAEFQKQIFEDPNVDGTWTNYIPLLERKLYKGGKK
ncbi:MAG: HD domain-containing protein [Planctomycetaceae bacterium]|nr:HD domain-containing protein [Planctomycetaceae bacterium]